MRKIRLNIGGEKGNIFYIMGTVRRLADSREEADDICDQMMGTTFTALGGRGNDYEGALRVFLKHFPFVEFYSTTDVGIDPELYTLDEDPEIYEL